MVIVVGYDVFCKLFTCWFPAGSAVEADWGPGYAHNLMDFRRWGLVEGAGLLGASH